MMEGSPAWEERLYAGDGSRRDKLVEVPVVLGQKPADAVWLARMDKPTDAQKAAYQAWLGTLWEEPG
ncbi:hypothetical protein F0U63_14045 [Cystobacter fuscus]|nr:hypothetical protein F0U63_14045 [Cystobacter fuscus]